MLLAKGLVFSLIGGALAAAVWVGIILATGWNAWLLCPIVGGGAGLGMMWGTKMRGGVEAGLLAALSAGLSIGAARYVHVSNALGHLTATTENDLIDDLAWTVAEEWDSQGFEVFDDDEDLLPEVYAEAERRWFMLTASERAEAMAAAEHEGDEFAAAATPLTMLLDFGIFGTVCTCLTLGAAFQTGATRLEAALAQRGKVANSTQAAELASRLRGGENIAEGPLAGPAPRVASAPQKGPTRAAAPAAAPESTAEESMAFRLPVSEPPKTARRAIMTAADDGQRSAA